MSKAEQRARSAAAYSSNSRFAQEDEASRYSRSGGLSHYVSKRKKARRKSRVIRTVLIALLALVVGGGVAAAAYIAVTRRRNNNILIVNDKEFNHRRGIFFLQCFNC